MIVKFAFSTLLIWGLSYSSLAQEKPKQVPVELAVLEASDGVWDAEIEVWPQGLDSPPVKFKGVETNRRYGKYWIASDFDSEFMGQTMKVHSIIGYDLDKKKLVGTVVDHGPYAASMIGEYDKDSKTVRWKTEVKDPSGKLIVQRTSIKHENAGKRVLVLSVPGKETDEFKKLMQITYVKRD